MGFSYWEKTRFAEKKNCIIIGSGIVGLSAAIQVKQDNPDWSVLVLERGMLPSGASTKNAGFACFGSVTEIQDDLNDASSDAVFSLVEKRLQGLKTLRSRLGDVGVGYQGLGSYELFTDASTFEKAAADIPEFNRLLEPITGKSETFEIADQDISRFGFQCKHLIKNHSEGQIDTGLMMRSLISLSRKLGVEIWNGAQVNEFTEENNNVIIHGNDWEIQTERLIIATNGFAKQLLPEIHVDPGRNQVIITEPIPDLQIKGTFHFDRGYYYFRNIDSRILFGGGRHLDPKESTAEFGSTEIIQSKLEELLSTVILPTKVVKIAHQWSGILGLGKIKSPIIKRHSERIVVAVRLGGMGIAIGSLVGEKAGKICSTINA